MLKYARHIAIALVISGAVLSYAATWNNTLVVDEVSHIPAGYSYLMKGDMRLNPEHPPLVKDLAAFPLLFLKLNQDAFESPNWTINVNEQWKFGRQLLYRSGNNADLIGRLAHIPMLVFFALSAWIIWKWSKKLYGESAALLAVFLFSLSPTVLAHAPLVTTDVAALFGVLSASYFFVQYLQQPTRRNFGLASIFFGIALLCKFSTFLLVPLFVLATLLWNYKKIFPTLLVMVVGFIIIVWPFYGLHVRNYPPERQRSDTFAQLESSNHFEYAKPIIWLSDKPILRAAGHYALGLFKVSQRWKGGTNVYFLGTVSQGAGLGYFPFTYLVKEPLAWWLLVLIAILVALRKKPTLSTDVKLMILWLLLYWAGSLRGALNVGIRHLLPIYPFMIILVAGALQNLKLKPLLFLLCAWYLVASLVAFPDYLSYYNISNGYRYIADSNVDWGQDLKRLEKWVTDNNVDSIQLDYFGWADPAYYLGDRFIPINAKQTPKPGWLAVSVTFLMNQSNDAYAWLFKQQPTAVVGNSIFVYRIIDNIK